MWTSVVVLGLAVNLEPTRIALITLLLAGRRPVRGLWALLAAGIGVSGLVGLAVLLVLHRVPVLSPASAAPGGSTPLDVNPAVIQIAIGAGALVLAGVLALRGGPVRIAAPSGRLQGAVGIGLSLPSIEYLALLALIVSSNEAPAVQVAALGVFLLLASTVTIAALASLLVAPDRTRSTARRVDQWVRARSKRQFALVTAIVGAVLLFSALPRM